MNDGKENIIKIGVVLREKKEEHKRIYLHHLLKQEKQGFRGRDKFCLCKILPSTSSSVITNSSTHLPSPPSPLHLGGNLRIFVEPLGELELDVMPLAKGKSLSRKLAQKFTSAL